MTSQSLFTSGETSPCQPVPGCVPLSAEEAGVSEAPFKAVAWVPQHSREDASVTVGGQLGSWGWGGGWVTKGLFLFIPPLDAG